MLVFEIGQRNVVREQLERIVELYELEPVVGVMERMDRTVRDSLTEVRLTGGRLQHRSNYATVGDDNDVFPAVFRCESVHRREDSHFDVLARFTTGDWGVVRIERFEFRTRHAFCLAVVALDEFVVGDGHRHSEGGGDDARGLEGAGQWARHDEVPASPLHLLARFQGLRSTRVVERDVRRALNSAEQIPIGFTVANKKEVCHCVSSLRAVARG